MRYLQRIQILLMGAVLANASVFAAAPEGEGYGQQPPPQSQGGYGQQPPQGQGGYGQPSPGHQGPSDEGGSLRFTPPAWQSQQDQMPQNQPAQRDERLSAEEAPPTDSSDIQN